MPRIKPRTRGKDMMRHQTRFDRDNTETLYAYARFIGEPTEYILNQLVERVLARDQEFITWRGSHPGTFGPKAARSRAVAPSRDTRTDRRDGAAASTSRIAG